MTYTDGWSRPSYVKMSGLEGKAMFECVESSFTFNRCLRQGSVDAPRLWQMMVAQLLASVEAVETEKKKHGSLVGLQRRGEKAHQICSFMWTDNFWIVSHSKRNWEQLLRDLIEEAEKWDLAPKLASLWWTSTYEEEERSKSACCHQWTDVRIPYWREIQDSGMCDEQAREDSWCDWGKNTVCHKNLLEVHRSKDVPWRVKCRRLVDHVHSVFSFGRWETEMMMRLFRFKRKMKHGSNSIQDAAKRPGRFGYRRAYLFCMKYLLKACGELWDVYVIRGLMQSSLTWSWFSGGEVLNGGMPHTLREWEMIQWTTPGGNTNGSDTIEDMSGTKSPRTGLVRMIGSEKGRTKLRQLTRPTLRQMYWPVWICQLPTGKQKIKGTEKHAGSKPPRKSGPADAAVYTREDGPAVHLCGDSEVVGKWMRKNKGWLRKPCTNGGKGRWPTPSQRLMTV